MWKKFAIAGVIAAAVVGSGTAALAVAGDSGTPTPAPSSSGSSPSTAHKHPGSGRAGHGPRVRAQAFQHGEWVTKGASGDVTHDAIHGAVTSVGPTSISVRADDGFSQTFTVSGDTKVVLRENGKGSAKKAAIGDVKQGDHVFVTGVKAASGVGANHVLDTGIK